MGESLQCYVPVACELQSSHVHRGVPPQQVTTKDVVPVDCVTVGDPIVSILGRSIRSLSSTSSPHHVIPAPLALVPASGQNTSSTLPCPTSFRCSSEDPAMPGTGTASKRLSQTLLDHIQGPAFVECSEFSGKTFRVSRPDVPGSLPRSAHRKSRIPLPERGYHDERLLISQATSEDGDEEVSSGSMHNPKLLKSKIAQMGKHMNKIAAGDVNLDQDHLSSTASVVISFKDRSEMQVEEPDAAVVAHLASVPRASVPSWNLDASLSGAESEPSASLTAQSFPAELTPKAVEIQQACSQLQDPAITLATVEDPEAALASPTLPAKSSLESAALGSNVEVSLEKPMTYRNVGIQVDDLPRYTKAGSLGDGVSEQQLCTKHLSSKTDPLARELTRSLYVTKMSWQQRSHLVRQRLLCSMFELPKEPLSLAEEGRELPGRLAVSESLESIPAQGGEVVTASSCGKSPKKNVQDGMGLLPWVWHNFKVWRLQRNYRRGKNPFFVEKIHLIEGQFGSGVVSLFVFMRWFFFHNCLLAVLWLLLVVLPQALDFNYDIFHNNFYIHNILDGQNAVTSSWLFYGGYSDAVVLNFIGSYPLPLMYFLCIVISFWGGLFLVLRRMALASQDRGQVSSAVSHCKFALLVLSSWDYSRSSETASTSLSMGIANSLKNLCQEEMVKQAAEGLSQRKEGWIAVCRCAAWTIVLLLMGGGCVAITYLVRENPQDFLDFLGYQASEKNLLVLYSPLVIFIVLGTIVPHVVYKLPNLERYSSGQAEVSVTICRVFLLHMAYLLALVANLYAKVEKGLSDICAGTLLGRSLYQLLILDTINEALTCLLPSFVYYCWTMKKREVHMSHIVLKIFYTQGLIWLGLLVCPVMPLVGALSFFLYFHIQYFVITRTCSPPSKPWNQPQCSVFFMGPMVVTLVLLIVPVSLVITSDQIQKLGTFPDSAEICGPFGNRTMSDEIAAVVNSIATERPLVAKVLSTITSDVVLASAVFLAVGLVYFQHMRINHERVNRQITLTDLDQEKKRSQLLQRHLQQLVHNIANSRLGRGTQTKLL